MHETGTERFSERKCKPCEGEENPLSKEEAKKNLEGLKGWNLNDEATVIYKEYNMKDFLSAVDHVGNIAKIAEEQGHHPDIHLTGYRKLKVEFSTHAIKGLSENDFIMAAKVDELPVQLKS